MFLLKLTPIFILVFCVSRKVNSEEKCASDEEEIWSYHGETNGPADWGEKYPVCNGQQQSPIDIRKENVTKNDTLERINFNAAYREPVEQYTILNNGHTVQITPDDGKSRCIEGGHLSDVYCLSQCHFHWGKDNNEGSEHLIDGKSYPMEMHCVHFSANNGTVVIAVLFKVKYCLYSHVPFSLTNFLELVRYKGEQATVQSRLNLMGIIPWSESYFSYTGSLTTPPCSQGVEWIIYKKIQCIGCDQMKIFQNNLFRTEKSAEEQCKLNGNFRPVQPLNGREIREVKKRRQ